MYAPRIALAALALTLVSGLARADVPPPEGRTRVHYQFQIDAVPAGMTAVAFPGYNFDDDGSPVITLTAGKDVPSVQGYTPGIYVLASADAAALPRKDKDAADAYLTAHARQCLKKIPRVFEVDETTAITKMTDIIHLDATATACTAQLVRTIYEGSAGQRGEGGVDVAGKRSPPAPFGADLPDVNASGFGASNLAPTPAPTPEPTPAPTPTPTPTVTANKPPAENQSGGCVGCTTGSGGDPGLWLLALTGAALLRRRRS